MDEHMLDRNEIAIRFAIFTLKKIASDTSKDGQMISAYQMLAQVTLKQILDVLDSSNEITTMGLIIEQ